MPDVYRVTIRLTPPLYAQLAARGSHGQSLAAIIREALEHYLAQQPEQPAAVEDLTITVAAMTARLEALDAQVKHLAARLDGVATTQQPVAARRQSRQSPQQPVAARATADDSHEQPGLDQRPAYDPTRFVLGHLCPRGHEYGTTGQTLLRLPSRNCPICTNAFKREQRAAKRGG